MHFKNVYTALTDTIETSKIDKNDLKNLLIAFKQDVSKKMYRNFDELLDYSKYSANPVGHLVLQVFGYDKEKNKDMFGLSDYVCSGLQFANFWQDVSLDLKLNRVYVPLDTMEKYQYNLQDLYTKVENDKFKRVMKELADITEDMFTKGKDLPKLLKGRLKLEIAATINGGMKVLELIRKSNYKVLSYRVKLSKTDKFKILLSSFFK
jgi:phytoene/squalene synthetase